MKKRMVSLMLAVSMALSLTACGGSGGGKTEEKKAEAGAAKEENADGETLSPEADAIEDKTITWAKDNSGNTFLAIAQREGWFEELGITIEEVPIDANNDAMTALSNGQLDIFTNYGTSGPLQQIASGEDFLIIGGYMATGCIPIVAKAGTEWNGIEDFVGKRVAGEPHNYALTGGLLELGYDPMKDVEWVSYPTASDKLAAVLKGEVDYAGASTSRNYEISKNKDLEIMTYYSDLMPWYSCCRMVITKEYAEQNPNTVKAIIKVLLRGQQYYETHHDECVDLMAEYMGVERDYVSVYMDNEHFRIHCDPLKHEVVKGWNIMEETGFLDEKAKDINIEDYIATDIYKEALDEAYEEYYDEDPEYWDRMIAFYEEHNL